MESKSQVIEGISRLICSAKQQQTMLKGIVSWRTMVTWAYHMTGCSDSDRLTEKDRAIVPELNIYIDEPKYYDYPFIN